MCNKSAELAAKLIRAGETISCEALRARPLGKMIKPKYLHLGRRCRGEALGLAFIHDDPEEKEGYFQRPRVTLDVESTSSP
jgi:hypothetical protein